ncbi:hypothetical protein [Actinosynnema sp. NPDC020468]|uniref:hypothetical protein n=1 Tax=Actinosynnema sp. NPDC020468 TaxID=3154488 RepID=UPI0033F9222F
MTLQLRFADNTHGASMIRQDSFKLHESGGRYVLPNILLTVPVGSVAVVTSLHVIAVDGAQGELASWLRGNWVVAQPSGLRVVSSVPVAKDVVVPTVVVNASLPVGDLAAGSRGRVGVTWRVTGTDTTGRPVDGDTRSVLLDFAPVGAGRATRSTPWTTVAVGHRGEPWLDNFAAVDFGTSSSTVTLYGGDPRRHLLDPAQAASLADSLANALLDTPGSDSQAEVDWKDATLRLENALAKSFPDRAWSTLRELALVLRTGPVRLDVLDAVCAELERALWAARGELRPWLADRLHAAYDTAFRVPALSGLRLHPVLFHDVQQRYDVPSALMVTRHDPLETEIEEETGTATVPVFRDLKRRFARNDTAPVEGMRNADGSDVRVEHLVAWFYELLVRRTEEFAHDEERPQVESVARLVVTYPTTTTPARRSSLERLLKDALGVRWVDTTYDEGVAAGLYFLMRDFGGPGAQALGVETLRANSRRIEGTSTWRQVMLVLDIGAGTTDIALIALNLVDATPDMPHADPEVKGRYYRIEPEVLGTSGHEVLGGDYLTLRVFYWIKAAILDALAANSRQGPARDALVESLPEQFRPDPRRPNPCTQAVLSGDASAPAPEPVADELRSKLDTRYRPESDPAERQAAFYVLWNEAEKAKMALGQGRAHVVTDVVLKRFFDRLPHRTHQYDQLIPENGVTLDPASFERLARPVLAQAVELAHHLAQSRLPKLAGGRLDRVMLSGKTSLMPLVARMVGERLGRRAGDYVPQEDREGAEVKPPTVEVEAVFAKQAASLGACWAQSVVEFVLPQTDVEEIANGRTFHNISVDNLFTAVPSNFALQNDLPIRVLDIGTPFTELDAVGTLGVRADRWLPLPQTLELQREMGPDRVLLWAQYTFRDHAEETGFVDYDRAVWEQSGSSEPTMAAMIELDQACTPRLNLCNHGRPHHVSRDHAIPLRGVPSVEFGPDGRLVRLPRLVARTARGTSASSGVEVVLCEATELTDPVSVFPLIVHAEDDAESPAVPAFDLPLPPASSAHRSYGFFVVLPDGREVYLDELAAPGRPSRTARYHVTVTADGALRVHRGELPFLTAHNLEEVQNVPGTVLSVRLKEPPNPTRPAMLPFTGVH